MKKFILFFLYNTFLFSQISNIPGGGSGQGFIYTGALATIPSTCTLGQISFITDATPGQNQYNCTATNTWTQNLNSGTSGASAALDNLSAVSVNTSLLAQSGVDAGSLTKPFRNLFLWGTGTFGSTSIKLTGTPTGNRVIILPDVTGTFAVSAVSPITLSAAGAIGCVTCGVTGTALSQFAATTSAQLAGVINDETGGNLLVFNTSPTIVTPTIASFTNAGHSHANAAGGGTLAEAALALTDITTNNATTSAHGFMAKFPGGTTTFLRADGSFATPSGAGTVSVVGAGSLTSTALVTGGGTTTLQTPSATATMDSSGNISIPGTITATNGVSTGASAPSVTAGTGGVSAGKEGTAPSVCAAVGVDCLYEDSTQHGLLLSVNNGSYLPIPQGPASTTSGNVTTWNASNGGVIADAGFLATNVVRKDAANTGAAAMTLDMSSSSGSNSLKVPYIAGATASANGAFIEDSTSKNYHGFSNGADSIFAPFAVTALPSNSDCIKAVVNASNYLLADAGGACVTGSAYQTVESNASAQTQRSTVNLISGSNATVSCVDNAGATRTDCTISASSSAGARLDQVTAATGANTIHNANNDQVWDWTLTSAGTYGFTFTENTASTATGTSGLININTLATSTLNPLTVTAVGTANGVFVNTSGVLAKKGSGSVNADAINGTAVSGTNGNVWTYGASNTPADSGFLATNVVRKDSANTMAAATTFPGGDLILAGVNAQTGTTYTVVAGDANKLVTYSNAGAIAVTLPQANGAGFTSGHYFPQKNLGVGTVTITPTTSTINGAATLVLTTSQDTMIYSDGTNYFASVDSGTGNTVVGGTCTNQAATAITALTGAPTCTTITSAYVNNSIALTGTDINTSNQVTATHLAAALPANQGGTGQTGTAHGNSTHVQISDGTGTSGNVAKFDANGNVVDGAAVAANLVVASSPGAGIAHFAGSTQTATSSAVVSADLNITTTTCTAPQMLTAISATATATCTTPVITQNSQSAAYTTVLGDGGKMIFHPAADTTARTFTIDSNANVAYPLGTCITFVNETLGGVVTIAITSDTLLFAGAASTGSRTLAASNIATACKITTTKWIINGSSGLT